MGPAAADRATDGMVGLSTPRLIWVERCRDDRAVPRAGGDDGAETLRTQDPYRGMTAAMSGGQPGAATPGVDRQSSRHP